MKSIQHTPIPSDVIISCECKVTKLGYLQMKKTLRSNERSLGQRYITESPNLTKLDYQSRSRDFTVYK